MFLSPLGGIEEKEKKKLTTKKGKRAGFGDRVRLEIAPLPPIVSEVKHSVLGGPGGGTDYWVWVNKAQDKTSRPRLSVETWLGWVINSDGRLVF